VVVWREASRHRHGPGIRRFDALNGDDFVIYEEDMEAIQEELGHFLRESEATCALLVHKSGQLVAKRGFTQRLDTTSLAALAAGAFASTQEIARLIGEPEFSVLFHEGRHEHIHVSLAGEHAIMVTLFDDRTTIGMIRLFAAETSPRLDAIFRSAAQRQVRGTDAVASLGEEDVFGAPGGQDEEEPRRRPRLANRHRTFRHGVRDRWL
jgi:predicted regulator of Ras-like GTPase activity (Roadblock/LC7/MglB family)